MDVLLELIEIGRMMRLLEEHEAHCWEIDLVDDRLDQFSTCLDFDETRKMQSFYSLSLQQQYRRAHISLRLILSQYLAVAPREIVFRTSAFGKPSIPQGGIEFNLSHTGSTVAVALSTLPVGIDIECIKNFQGLDGVISLVCSTEEVALLRSLDNAMKMRRFFEIWTRKEAYCKALGLGLQKSLANIHFEDRKLCGHSVVDIDFVNARYFCRDLRLRTTGIFGSLCTPTPNPAVVYLSNHDVFQHPAHLY